MPQCVKITDTYPLLRYSIACFTNVHRLLVIVWTLDVLHCLRETNNDSTTDGSDNLVQSVCGTVNINSLPNIPAGPFTQIQYHLSVVPDRLMFLACLLTSHRVTSPSPHRFSISDTYQTGAWDGDHRTQRRSLYPVSPERMNRSGTTKHTLPPDCLGHHGPEKRGRENKKE